LVYFMDNNRVVACIPHDIWVIAWLTLSWCMYSSWNLTCCMYFSWVMTLGLSHGDTWFVACIPLDIWLVARIPLDIWFVACISHESWHLACYMHYTWHLGCILGAKGTWQGLFAEEQRKVGLSFWDTIEFWRHWHFNKKN